MIVVVGQAPSMTNGRRRPLEGPCEKFLARLAGVELDEFRRRTRTINLLKKWPGRVTWARGGDTFPIWEARKSADKLRRTTLGEHVTRPGGMIECVVLLGRGVSEAFGQGHREFFEGFPMPRAHPVFQFSYVFPHPSGVSRWWNDRENRDRASRFMRRIYR
jgi:hypothetical protein